MAETVESLVETMDLGEDAPPETPLLKNTAVVPSNFQRADVKATIAYGAVLHFKTTAIAPNTLRPWKQNDPITFTGTGFYLGDKRIMTNCHNIRDSASIRLERHGQPGNFEGRVLCQSQISDLALLTVDDETFWEGVVAVTLQDDVPALDDTVVAVGYPLGAKSVTVTRGVVSNVSLSDLSLRNLSPQQLVVQIDAAINPGNSGGPVFNPKTGEVVGVAFAGKRDAQSVGFVVPVPVLKLFLRMYERSQNPHCGFLPALGIGTETLENPSMRKSCFGGKLPAHRNGCLITSIMKFSCAAPQLKVDDILLEVDGQHVSEKGEVVFRSEERLNFRYLVTRKLVGDIIQVTVLRLVDEPHPDASDTNGSGIKTMQELKLDITLNSPWNLVPNIEGLDYFSTYIIIGGLVVIPAGDPVRVAVERSYTNWRSHPVHRAVDKARKKVCDDKEEQCCILSSVLAHDLNVTYERYVGQLVEKVNGTKVKNMQHLVKLISDNDCDELVIDFDVPEERDMRSRVVFDVAKLKLHEADILKKSKVPVWCSPELLSLPAACQTEAS